MNRTWVKALLLSIVVVHLPLGAQSGSESSELREQLAPLGFLVGHCWSGAFPDDNHNDTHCFEPALNGMHVRDRHHVTGGASVYYGETIYSWNAESELITFVYWNSYGNVTRGSAHVEAHRIVFKDETYISPDGTEFQIKSRWEDIKANSYVSVVTQIGSDGSKSTRRTRFSRVEPEESDTGGT